MATLIDVPGKGTPKKTVRVDNALWLAFAQVCESEGISCAEDLRAHMRRRVEEHERKTASEQDSADG